jgi:hypothetical protein
MSQLESGEHFCDFYKDDLATDTLEYLNFFARHPGGPWITLVRSNFMIDHFSRCGCGSHNKYPLLSWATLLNREPVTFHRLP